ncbi:hypothetical protein [Zavarzinella formosa]|uniref:hypothetical protein n=1 Tax=Zavarzinella formosa TaxID=360055 RepID=UPI0003020285|nr:hypothetical protein [Zavarzinella formosa]
MTISMPSNGFRSSRFGLETDTAVFRPPQSKGSAQRAIFGPACWMLTVTLPKMNRAAAADWQAFFLLLEGQANTFYGYDPDGRTGRGVLTGSPLVKGTNQNGSTLVIDGCSANVTGWIKTGDYFSVNGELKMVTADASTNGSGEVTVSFKPALRSSPADNAPVTVINPTCLMVLTDDSQAMWETDANGIYNEITFSAVEVFA